MMRFHKKSFCADSPLLAIIPSNTISRLLYDFNLSQSRGGIVMSSLDLSENNYIFVIITLTVLPLYVPLKDSPSYALPDGSAVANLILILPFVP